MKRVKIKAYKCSYCGLTNTDKNYILYHENEECLFNPKFRLCNSCIHKLAKKWSYRLCSYYHKCGRSFSEARKQNVNNGITIACPEHEYERK